MPAKMRKEYGIPGRQGLQERIMLVTLQERKKEARQICCSGRAEMARRVGPRKHREDTDENSDEKRTKGPVL